MLDFNKSTNQNNKCLDINKSNLLNWEHNENKNSAKNSNEDKEVDLSEIYRAKSEIR